MTPVQTALWIVLGGALVISVVTDIASQRILDVITYPTLLLSLILRFFDQPEATFSVAGGLLGVERGVLGGVLCAIGAASLFAVAAMRGTMGWGDVKLMAAVGAAMAWPLVLYAVACVTLAGALQAIVTLMWKGKVWETAASTLQKIGKKLKLVPKQTPIAEGQHIPYGVAIAMGTFWAMWWQYPADNFAR